MQLGKGRLVRQHDWFELWLWSAPFWGRWFFDWLRPFQPLGLDTAINPYMLICGQPGAGKTNLGRYLITQQMEAGMGGMILDAKAGKESLGQYAIELAAEQGKSPEQVFICNFFSEFGHPVIDFLYDEKNDEVSAFQIVEELVSATALLSERRSDAGARQLDIARMSFLPLVLAERPLVDISQFLIDPAFRTNVVNKTEHALLQRFWCGEHSYFSKLSRDGTIL